MIECKWKSEEDSGMSHLSNLKNESVFLAADSFSQQVKITIGQNDDKTQINKFSLVIWVEFNWYIRNWMRYNEWGSSKLLKSWMKQSYLRRNSYEANAVE